MITSSQKNKIIQIINVFETGTKDGRYDLIATYADGKNGSRQITYGRSQTTEQGNLKALIEKYFANKGALAGEFKIYLPKIGKTPLVDNVAFKNLLKKAAKQDPVMRKSQYDFFDVLYYQPAFHFFEKNKFTHALSLLVIYDSYIHSGSVPAFIREKFAENVPLNGGDEKKWIKKYTEARHSWLTNHSKQLLRKTNYRTKCFLEQIATGNWDLSKSSNANGTLL